MLLGIAWLFLGTSKGPHREAVWVGLQGAGERAAGACEPLVHVGHRVVRFFALRLARARRVAAEGEFGLVGRLVCSSDGQRWHGASKGRRLELRHAVQSAGS